MFPSINRRLKRLGYKKDKQDNYEKITEHRRTILTFIDGGIKLKIYAGAYKEIE
jgi:hypothetical protein